jgi:hypothetical protein
MVCGTAKPIFISTTAAHCVIAATADTAYTYNATGTRLVSAGGTTQTYDNEGQVTAKGTETYKPRRKLSRAIYLDFFNHLFIGHKKTCP